jgi:hypothetical protein
LLFYVNIQKINYKWIKNKMQKIPWNIVQIRRVEMFTKSPPWLVATFSDLEHNLWLQFCILEIWQFCISWGILGHPKVSLRPAMPNRSTFYTLRAATPETASHPFQGNPHRYPRPCGPDIRYPSFQLYDSRHSDSLPTVTVSSCQQHGKGLRLTVFELLQFDLLQVLLQIWLKSN